MPYHQSLGLSYQYIQQNNHAVILLPSFLWDHNMWQRQTACLREQGYSILSLDYRGHGQSADIVAQGLSFSAMADDIVQLAKSLAIEQCSVVGLSIGGMLSAQLAYRYPEFVRDVVMLGTYIGPEPSAAKQRYFALLQAIRTLQQFIKSLISQIIPLCFSPHTLQQGALPEYIKEWEHTLLSMPVKRVLALANMAEMIFSREDFRSHFATIEQPVSFIVGENDTARPPSESQEMAVILKKHHPHNDYPVATSFIN